MEPLDLAIGLRAVRPRVLRMIVWASQVSRRRCERYLPPLSDMTGAMVTPRSANNTTARCRMAAVTVVSSSTSVYATREWPSRTSVEPDEVPLS